MMELALAKHGVPFESHIYPNGGHGFSTGQKWLNRADVCPEAARWPADSVRWLERMGLGPV